MKQTSWFIFQALWHSRSLVCSHRILHARLFLCFLSSEMYLIHYYVSSLMHTKKSNISILCVTAAGQNTWIRTRTWHTRRTCSSIYFFCCLYQTHPSGTNAMERIKGRQHLESDAGKLHVYHIQVDMSTCQRFCQKPVESKAKQCCPGRKNPTVLFLMLP